MMDDISDIKAFYDSGPEFEHQRLDAHRLEFDLTWRYLDRFLPAQGSILEIGAATGRYTVELARRGYSVTAVDLSPGLLTRCLQNLRAAGLESQVRLIAADARDLSAVGDRSFDAVLLMGPLYHLIERGDRMTALQEAARCLRPGGVFVSALLSRMGVLSDLIARNPGWIEGQAEVRSMLKDGKRPDEAPRGGFRGYFAPAAEIAPLHEAVGLETLAVAGVEPVIGADDASYNRLEGHQRALWLEVLFEISAEPSILGSSRHLLYVGRKPNGPG